MKTADAAYDDFKFSMMTRTTCEDAEGNEDNTNEGFPGRNRTKLDVQPRIEPKKPVRKSSILGVEAVDRGQWSGPFDFLMSMIAYAVGLGL